MQSNEKEIIEFMKHLQDSADEMLNILEDRDYEDRFDVTIGVNGKDVRIGLCAETFHLLMEILDVEIS